MEAMEAILSRASIRQFTDEPISEEDMHAILEAGMCGPSCKNLRDWHFIVVRDKETLGKMADANGIFAKPLRSAAAGILICGDLDRAFPEAKGYWVVDGAIAGENMTLAAHALGLGSVWLGTYPQKERVDGLTAVFGLPENCIPHSILALGHPAPDAWKRPRPAFEEDRVHYEVW